MLSEVITDFCDHLFSLANLVTRLLVQIRLMGNSDFSACGPWTVRADEPLCFVCKEAKDDLHHFLFDCSYFRKNFDSLWSKLDVKAPNCSPTDGTQISAFIKKLDQDSKALLLLGCLPLPSDSMTLTVIARFVASTIGKIYKLHTERLRELEAPWLHKQLIPKNFTVFYHHRNFYAFLRSYFTIFNMIPYLVYFLKTENT